MWRTQLRSRSESDMIASVSECLSSTDYADAWSLSRQRSVSISISIYALWKEDSSIRYNCLHHVSRNYIQEQVLQDEKLVSKYNMEKKYKGGFHLARVGSHALHYVRPQEKAAECSESDQQLISKTDCFSWKWYTIKLEGSTPRRPIGNTRLGRKGWRNPACSCTPSSAYHWNWISGTGKCLKHSLLCIVITDQNELISREITVWQRIC